jgi:vacuolar-type H+-ATPase subunit E/Vma4
MPDFDNRDYIAAIVIGTLLGVGAAFVLRKEPTRREKLARELKPYGKAIRKSAKRARGSIEDSAGDALEYGEELLVASREILDGFRDEVAKIVTDARDELSDTISDQVKEARKAMKRGLAGIR